LNEIHGSWYDPSNPVVAMSGALRADLFADLLKWEEKTSLTIALGTSMCGMNADRVFSTVAEKGRRAFERERVKAYSEDGALQPIGGVIVGLQQTQYDADSCLRIFATIDEVMCLLLLALGLSPPLPPELISCTIDNDDDEDNVNSCQQVVKNSSNSKDLFNIPYDSAGSKSKTFTSLNLCEGARVRLTIGPHTGDEGEVKGKNREGHYVFMFQHAIKKSSSFKVPFERVMGRWWVDVAKRGKLETFPIVNL